MLDLLLYHDAKQAAETLLFAESLGTKELAILFTKHDKSNEEAFSSLRGLIKANLKKGLLVKNAQEAQKYAQHYDLLVGKATRDCVESRLVTHVYGAETMEEKDRTHHRASGMNQVIAKLLSEKEKTYVFDASSLFTKEQALVLGRMQQNKRILKKYAVTMLCCSLTTTPLRVRAPKEREHFLRWL